MTFFTKFALFTSEKVGGATQGCLLIAKTILSHSVSLFLNKNPNKHNLVLNRDEIDWSANIIYSSLDITAVK